MYALLTANEVHEGSIYSSLVVDLKNILDAHETVRGRGCNKCEWVRVGASTE